MTNEITSTQLLQDFLNNEPIQTVAIKLGKKTIYHHRSVYNILDFFGDLGGFIEILLIMS